MVEPMYLLSMYWTLTESESQTPPLQAHLNFHMQNFKAQRKFLIEFDHNRWVLWAELYLPLPKFPRWNPNPQLVRMRLYLETGPLKLWLSWDEASRVGPNPFWLLPRMERKSGHKETTPGCAYTEERPGKRQQEGGHLQVKQRDPP